jgi:hypothetical protein
MLWRQKLCVLAGIGGLVVMGLFPPWYRALRGVSVFVGYAYLFRPPEIARIDVPVLCAQWAGWAVLTAALVLVAGRSRRPRQCGADDYVVRKAAGLLDIAEFLDFLDEKELCIRPRGPATEPTPSAPPAPPAPR